jgi:hypothetical protein
MSMHGRIKARSRREGKKKCGGLGGWKAWGGTGGVSDAGVLRCAQDDPTKKQLQKQDPLLHVGRNRANISHP